MMDVRCEVSTYRSQTGTCQLSVGGLTEGEESSYAIIACHDDFKGHAAHMNHSIASGKLTSRPQAGNLQAELASHTQCMPHMVSVWLLLHSSHCPDTVHSGCLRIWFLWWNNLAGVVVLDKMVSHTVCLLATGPQAQPLAGDLATVCEMSERVLTCSTTNYIGLVLHCMIYGLCCCGVAAA